MRPEVGKRQGLRVMEHCILVVHVGKVLHVAVRRRVHEWPRQVVHVGTIRLEVLQFWLPRSTLVLNS